MGESSTDGSVALGNPKFLGVNSQLVSRVMEGFSNYLQIGLIHLMSCGYLVVVAVDGNGKASLERDNQFKLAHECNFFKYRDLSRGMYMKVQAHFDYLELSFLQLRLKASFLDTE